MAVICFALFVDHSAASVRVKTGARAGTHTDVTVAVSGRTLKLKRVRRLNVDFPEGLSFNTRVGSSRCKPTTYLRRKCDGSVVVGRVSIGVLSKGRRVRMSGSLKLLSTGRGMIATYGVSFRIPASLGMRQREMRLTDRVRLRASDNGVNHSFGDIYRDLSGFGRQIESLTVQFKGRVGKGRAARYLVTNPTRCNGAVFRVAATTWAGYFTPIQSLRTYDGCNALPFNPRFSFAADSGTRRAATGFTTEFGVPFEDASVQNAQIRRATVRMPPGASWNQSALDGAAVCSAAAVAASKCGAGSRIGTATAEVAATELNGEIHVVAHQAGVSRAKVFLRSSLNARMTLDASLTTEAGEFAELTLDDAAQLPLGVRLSFTRPLLVNSRTCGVNVVTGEFTSYTDAFTTRAAVYPVSGCPGSPGAPRILSGPGDQSFLNVTEVAFAFDSPDATPEDPTTFECSPNGEPFATCDSPFERDGLGEGTLSFAVRALRDGNVGDAVARTFTIDRTDPVVTIDQPSAGAFTGISSPSISASVVDANPGVNTCSFDGGPFVACPAQSAELGDGSHQLTVRHTDKAGNSATAGPRAFTVDTIAPVVVLTAPADAGFTNDSTPALSFAVTEANPGATQCRVDGGAPSGCSSGVSTSALTDGNHSVSVTHADLAGNAATTATAFTVDTVAPVVSLTQPANGSYTADNTQEVTFTVTEANQTAASQCAVDGGSNVSCTSGTIVSLPGDGVHTVAVTHTDKAGNTSNAAGTAAVTVDTVAPVVAIVTPEATLYDGDPITPSTSVVDANPGADQCSVDNGALGACPPSLDLNDGSHNLGVTHTDLAGNIGTAVRAFSVDGTDPTVAVVSPVDGLDYDGAPVPVSHAIADANIGATQCRIDGGAYSACPSSLNLSDGAHTITVRHTDGAGNASTSSSAFTVDGTDPVVAVSSPASGAATNDNTPAVAFSATDAAVVTTQCAVDGGALGACASPFTTPALADGSHTVTVSATDAVGNSATDDVTFTIDTLAPAVTITSPLPDAWVTTSSPQISFNTVDTTATSARCRVDSEAWASCGSPWNPPSLPQGSHTASVEATDAAGNVSVATVALKVDSIAPVVTVAQPVDGAATGDSSPASVVSVTEENGGSTECRVDGGSWGGCPAELPVLSDGVHTFDARHTDPAGNVGSDGSTFTVDTIAPVVTITSPLEGQLHDGEPVPLEFTITDANPDNSQCQIDGGAWDSCPASLDLSDGPHTIAVSHTDAAGNTGATTRSFAVDATDPVVAIASPVDAALVDGATVPLNYNVTEANPGSTECKLDAAAFGPCPSDLDLSDGVHTVTVRHTDAVGNIGSATNTYTVDSTAPVVTVTSPAAGQVYGDDAVPLTLAVVDPHPGTSECAIDGGSFGPCPPNLDLPEGLHTVAAHHTDAVGNVGTTSSTFTVDTTAPSVSLTSPVDGQTYNGDPIALTYTLTEAHPGSTQCQLDGGAWGACPASIDLPDGSHSVTVRHTDAAGNLGSASHTFIVDSVSPVVTITSPVDGQTYNGDPIPLSWTNTKPHPGQTRCSVDGGSFTNCPASLELLDGTHTVTVRHTDSSGNIGLDTATFTVDAAAPSISITSPANGSVTSDADPGVAFNVVDATAVTAQCRVDTDALTSCNSPWIAPSLAEGAHTVTVQATDAAGNTSSATNSFTVDTTAPAVSITSPADAATYDTDPITPDISITDDNPGTSSCELDSVAVACGDPIDAPEGGHSFAVTHTDAAGNSASAASAFTVDTTAPAVSITSPADAATYDTDPITPDITITDDNPGTSSCELDSVAVACGDPLSPGAGTHTFSVMHVDVAGNSGAASATFEIVP
jgi:hypothetical protein